MKINLLPQKFVKNRAPEVIIIVTVALTSILIFLCLIGSLMLNSRVTKIRADVQLAKLEKINLEKEVKKVEQSQSKELQDFLKIFKSDKSLMDPIMNDFQEVATKLQLEIISYDVSFSDTQSEENESLTSSEGIELLSPVQMILSGDFFDQMPKYKEEIEKLDWVYDAQLVSIKNTNDNNEAEYLIRLKKTEIPGALNQEVKK